MNVKKTVIAILAATIMIAVAVGINGLSVSKEKIVIPEGLSLTIGKAGYMNAANFTVNISGELSVNFTAWKGSTMYILNQAQYQSFVARDTVTKSYYSTGLPCVGFSTVVPISITRGTYFIIFQGVGNQTSVRIYNMSLSYVTEAGLGAL